MAGYFFAEPATPAYARRKVEEFIAHTEPVCNAEPPDTSDGHRVAYKLLDIIKDLHSTGATYLPFCLCLLWSLRTRDAIVDAAQTLETLFAALGPITEQGNPKGGAQ